MIGYNTQYNYTSTGLLNASTSPYISTVIVMLFLRKPDQVVQIAIFVHHFFLILQTLFSVISCISYLQSIIAAQMLSLGGDGQFR